MREFYRLFSWFIQQYRRSYVIGIVAAVIIQIISLVSPWLLGIMTDKVISGTLAFSLVVGGTIAVFAMAASQALLSYVSDSRIFLAEDAVAQVARSRFMQKILKQKPTFFAKNSTGSLMGKATNDVNAISQGVSIGVYEWFESHWYTLGCIIALLLTNSWKLIFVALIPMPILAAVAVGLENGFSKYYTAMQESFDKMNERVLEEVSGVRLVRAYAAESSASANFAGAANDLYHKSMGLTVVQTFFPIIGKMIPTFSFIIALIYGAFLIAQGEITVGQLVSFSFYINMLIWPMMAFGEYLSMKRQAIESMKRIDEILTYKEDMVDVDNAIEYDGRGDIEFDDVSFTYPETDLEVLSHISFSLKQGQTLGIVGPVGSGKTTLVKQLLHFYNIDTGQIRLGGRDISEYQLESFYRHTGYVPQTHIMFSKSVQQNIEMGLTETTPFTTAEVVAIADFTKDIAQLEQGMDTQVGERGVALSGGQKQRIGIARALLCDPALLVLDDALSAVDSRTETKILENLRQTRQDKTTVIVTHRLSGVMHADLILVLKDGKIEASGTHAELMASPTWYCQQFEHQRLERKSDGDDLKDNGNEE